PTKAQRHFGAVALFLNFLDAIGSAPLASIHSFIWCVTKSCLNAFSRGASPLGAEPVPSLRGKSTSDRTRRCGLVFGTGLNAMR
ncbi:MAG: hypothetical protein AAFR70_11335, partial [Pseudomonadota bacterium]